MNRLPCPFCGGSSLTTIEQVKMSVPQVAYALVRCKDCEGTAPEFAWNTRTLHAMDDASGVARQEGK